MAKKKCCGTCAYHVRGEVPGEGEWVCNNGESEYYGCETEYRFQECVDWEEKE